MLFAHAAVLFVISSRTSRMLMCIFVPDVSAIFHPNLGLLCFHCRAAHKHISVRIAHVFVLLLCFYYIFDTNMAALSLPS